MQPAALHWSTATCTIARTLDVVADRQSFLVLREVFLGVRRFGDIRDQTGLSRQVLTDRLVHLVDVGLLRRHAYRENGQRERQEYRLTDRGFDLYPVLLALKEWGDRYLVDPPGPPLAFRHRDCGAPVELVVRCADGHDVTQPRDVVPAPGPGAVAVTDARRTDARRRSTRPRSGTVSHRTNRNGVM